MKRIDVYYGNDHFSVGGRELEDLQRQIVEGIANAPSWLEVNDGEGMLRPSFLLLTPGVPLAVVPIPEPDVDGDEHAWEPGDPRASH